MAHTIADLASALGAEFKGDGTIEVDGAAEPGSATDRELALAMSRRYEADLSKGRARAAVLVQGADWQALGLEAAIFAPRARLAMARLNHLLAPDDAFGTGIHPSAVIDPAAEIADGAAVGPFTFVAAGAVIGPDARIGAHVSIGRHARIGAGARLHDGVRIGARVVAGARLVVQPNAVIGGDGFSFVTETPSGPERAKQTGGKETLTAPDHPRWHKIESLGSVEIGDDVEIGANTTIDAGTVRPTRIGAGTKIDNLVQVGHNVIVGEHCLLCGQVGIAGSVTIGDRVVLGGQTGVADQLRIGNDVVAGGGSIILASVPAGRVLLGYPAQRMDRALAAYRAQRRAARAPAGGATENTVPNPREGG